MKWPENNQEEVPGATHLSDLACVNEMVERSSIQHLEVGGTA